MKALKIFENPSKTPKFNLSDRDRALAQTWEFIAETYAKVNNDKKALKCFIKSEMFRRKHITTFKERRDYARCLQKIFAFYNKLGSNPMTTKKWENKLCEFLDSNLANYLYADMPGVQRLALQRKIDRTITDELLLHELNTLKMLEKQQQPFEHANIAKAHMNVGLAYMKIKDEEWAHKHFLKAFDLCETQLAANRENQAQCFYDIGSKLTNIEPEKALKFLNKSLEIRQTILEADGIKIAACHNVIGVTYVCNGMFDSALEHYNKALEIYEKHAHDDVEAKGEYSNCYSNIGVIHQGQGDYDKSTEFFLKAVKIASDAILDHRCFLCKCYRNLATNCSKKSEDDLSIAFYKKFLETVDTHIAEKSLCTAGDHSSEISDGLFALGRLYKKQNDYDKAIENYQQGIVHLETYTPDDYTNIALCYCFLAECYDNQKQYIMAIDYYKQGTNIYEQHLPDNQEMYAGILCQMSLCYLNIGKNEYQNATDCVRKALKIFEEHYPEKNNSITQCYWQYSLILYNKRNYNRGIDAAQKSLELRLLDEANKLQIALSYLLLAGFYSKTFDYQQAFQYATRAMEMYEKPSPEANNDQLIASIYHMIAYCLLRLNRYDEALLYGNKSSQIGNGILPEIDESRAHSHATLAFIYSEKQNYVSSNEPCRKALEICKQLIAKGTKTEVLGELFEGIGELYLDQDRVRKARKYYKRALKITKIERVDNHPDIERIQKIIDKLPKQFNNETSIF